MKLQTLACAIALATGGLFFSHTINQAMAETNATNVSQSIHPTQEQALVTRQLATLIDRQHYLNMRLDAATSNRILDMYLDLELVVMSSDIIYELKYIVILMIIYLSIYLLIKKLYVRRKEYL